MLTGTITDSGLDSPAEPYLPEIDDRVMSFIESTISARDADGGPFYVIDPARIISNFAVFAKYFPVAAIHFAVKANADPVILKTLARCGSGFEVGSRGELERISSLGVSAERILFSNPCKDERDILACCQLGVRWFVFETLDDLLRLQRLVPTAEYVLRLDLSHITEEFIDFGVTLSELEAMLTEDLKLCRRISGLTFYGCHTAGLQLCDRIISDLLPWVRYVNLGGGFLQPAFEAELSTGVAKGALNWLVAQIEDLCARHPVEVIVEPGAVLVKNACHGVSRVKYTRRGPRCDFYHVELGRSLGLTKALSAVYFLRTKNDREQVKKAWLVDSTCAKERLGRLTEIAALHEDDYVLFPHVGHYSTMYVSDFQLLRKPCIVYVPDDVARSAREFICDFAIVNTL